MKRLRDAIFECTKMAANSCSKRSAYWLKSTHFQINSLFQAFGNLESSAKNGGRTKPQTPRRSKTTRPNACYRLQSETGVGFSLKQTHKECHDHFIRLNWCLCFIPMLILIRPANNTHNFNFITEIYGNYGNRLKTSEDRVKFAIVVK